MMAATVIGWTGLASPGQDLALSARDSKWDYFLTARTAAGYKDNVTLAHLAPKASPFLDVGAEAVAARLPLDGTRLNFFGSFEDHRFLRSVGVDQEQIGFGQAQVSQFFSSHWQAGLGLDYLYQDQLLDVSLTETNLEAVRVQGHTIAARPNVRYDFNGPFWLELQTPVQRQLLREPLDHYWEGGPKFILGASYGHGSELAFSYEGNYRAYDHEEEFSAEGDRIPGSHRRLLQHRVQWSWRHYWDKDRRWRTTTRLTYRINNDNGSGWFDYTGVQLSEQLRYRAKTWEALAEVKLATFQYPVQTVSFTDSSHRTRKEFWVNCRVEKKLAKHLKVFAQYEREQIFSNLDLEAFTANTASGGLLWEF